VVLAALVVRFGEAVPPDRLAEALWVGVPPRTWPKVVQGCVLRLRRTLGASAIETTEAGYRLTLARVDVDTQQFEDLIERGNVLMATTEFDRVAVAFSRALGLWRGAPFDVLDGWSSGRIEAARLAELRRSAEERLLDARLGLGEHRDVVAVAEAQVAEEPLREHRWATLAVAMYRSGRQAEALRALRRARVTLVDQLGIEPGAELVALEAAILRQDASLLATPAPPVISEHCPYQGLAPYDVDDGDRFFGRDEEIATCLARLRSARLLIVTGPSGCGKSSLVRAGVVPALARDGRSAVVFVPGNDPAAAMTEALSSCTGSPVLIVDQFEELLTVDDEAHTRTRALCARLADYTSGRAPVVVVIRADHIAELSVNAEFARLVEQGLHLVSPLAGDCLREAIEDPATQAGLRLEAGLVDLLVRDCEGEPGALPLLSHALAETWQRRDGRVLTVEGYRATGEIRGAVARSADRLYESLPAEQRRTLRALLLRLVSPSTDGPPVRSRVATGAIGDDTDRDRVLRRLVRARLVTAEKDSVELAHEALARAWPRLQSWLDEDAAGQRILRHLTAAADGWESLGRPGSELIAASVSTPPWNGTGQRHRTSPPENVHSSTPPLLRQFWSVSGWPSRPAGKAARTAASVARWSVLVPC
jgi:DNA-binding SARP family transcriptional activator